MIKFNRGDFCNWKSQPERLVYLGTKSYRGDSRTWYQFALVDKPEAVWCEVLEQDLEGIEHTKDKP